MLETEGETMKKITSKSKAAVTHLFVCGEEYERVRAPLRLTIRSLFHQKRRNLLKKYTFAVTEDGHNACLWNLKNLGFDYIG